MSALSEWSDCVCLSICVSIFPTMFLPFPCVCIPVHAGFLFSRRALFSFTVAQPLPSFVFASFWFSAHKICSSSLPPSSLSPPSYSLVSVHTHLDPEGIRLDLLRSSQHRVGGPELLSVWATFRYRALIIYSVRFGVFGFHCDSCGIERNMIPLQTLSCV